MRTLDGISIMESMIFGKLPVNSISLHVGFEAQFQWNFK